MSLKIIQDRSKYLEQKRKSCLLEIIFMVFKFWEPIHAYGKFKFTDCKIPKRPCFKFSIYYQWTNALFYKRVIEILTRSQANMGGREKRCQDIRQISAGRDMLQVFEIAQYFICRQVLEQLSLLSIIEYYLGSRLDVYSLANDVLTLIS